MDERSERIADRFERPLLVAAVLTIPVTILQLLPPADPWRTIADVLNWTIWLTFLAEVVLMLAVLRKVITITVMLVGIGFAPLVIGAIAERFMNRPVHEFELTDEDLVEHVQDISARLQRLERALLQRQSGSS
jgi:hypothetical protein